MNTNKIITVYPKSLNEHRVYGLIKDDEDEYKLEIKKITTNIKFVTVYKKTITGWHMSSFSGQYYSLFGNKYGDLTYIMDLQCWDKIKQKLTVDDYEFLLKITRKSRDYWEEEAGKQERKYRWAYTQACKSGYKYVSKPRSN